MAFPSPKTLIGMIHLPPLPDYPDSPGIERIIEQAVADLRTLETAGFDGVLIENEYDRPHKVMASTATIDAMTLVTKTIVEESSATIVGCEILLNDPRSSLDVAKNSGASFIRTDYFVDLMSRPDYGTFEIDPDALLRYRESIDGDDILILADIQVKYATMIRERPLIESAIAACEKQADAVVVTGDASGDAPTVGLLRNAAQGTADYDIPLLIGSGLTASNALKLLAECDGAIVGTALMTDRIVDVDAANEIVSLSRNSTK